MLVLAFAATAVTAQSNPGQPRVSAQMATAASAPRVPMPSAQSIDQGMAEARKKGMMTSKDAMDQAARRAAAVADPSMFAKGIPKGEFLGVPATPNNGRPGDPMEIARQFNQVQGQFSEDERFNLIVFVSLSMPEETLKKLAADTRRAGGVIVLRGLKFGLEKGTWLKSVEAMKPLASTGANVQINPELFAQFGVKSVPTIVVTANPVGDKGCGDGSCAAGVGTVVGDVSLEYALERIAERTDGVGKIARQKFTKLN